MSDCIIVMNKGHFEQIGTAKEIYEKPNSKFVADFIGESNIFEATVQSVDKDKKIVVMTENGTVSTEGEGFDTGEMVYVSVRPENTRLSVEPIEGFTVKGIVKSQIYVGSVLKTIVELSNGFKVKVNTHPDDALFKEDTVVYIYWDIKKSVVMHTKEDKIYNAIEDAVLK